MEFLCPGPFVSYDESPKFSEEQKQQIGQLTELALKNQHLIVVFNKECSAYCPVEFIKMPDTYDVNRYGSTKIDIEQLQNDFQITGWVALSGDQTVDNTTIGEAGLLYVKAPIPEIEEHPAAYPYKMIEQHAKDCNWQAQFAGTRVGELYNFFASLDPAMYEQAEAPFGWTEAWLDETDFSVEEIQKWVSMNCPFPQDAKNLLDHGITVVDAAVVLNEETGSTIGSEYLEGHISMRAAQNLLGERTNSLVAIMTPKEAEERWGLQTGEVVKEFRRGVSAKFQAQVSKGWVRESGDTWLIHQKAMLEVYGEPKGGIKPDW